MTKSQCFEARVIDKRLDFGDIRQVLKLLLFLCAVALVVAIYRLVSGVGLSRGVLRAVGPTQCRILGHRRRSSSVRKIDGEYQSRCKRCGIALRKVGRDGDWEVDSSRAKVDRPAAIDHNEGAVEPSERDEERGHADV